MSELEKITEKWDDGCDTGEMDEGQIFQDLVDYCEKLETKVKNNGVLDNVSENFRKEQLIERMLKEKGDSNNIIDLDAYARGLTDMFEYMEVKNNSVLDNITNQKEVFISFLEDARKDDKYWYMYKSHIIVNKYLSNL